VKREWKWVHAIWGDGNHGLCSISLLVQCINTQVVIKNGGGNMLFGEAVTIVVAASVLLSSASTLR
jgi:hypothetical protein